MQQEEDQVGTCSDTQFSWLNQYSHQPRLMTTCAVVLEHPSISLVMNTCSETSDVIKNSYLHLGISDNSWFLMLK